MGTIYGHILKILYKLNCKYFRKNSDTGLLKIIKSNVGLYMFLLFLTLASAIFYRYQTEDVPVGQVQQEIAEEIIRFHVLANSDSSRDQALKLKVKDGIVTMLSDKLSSVESKEEARDILEEEMELIIKVAENIIREEGYFYNVRAYLEKHYFPVKIYGDLTFPSGEYDALRIEIGEGKGKNWWCVMYPPLCLINGTYNIVPDESKEKLQYVLTEEEYSSLLANKDVKVKAKFKLLEKLFD